MLKLETLLPSAKRFLRTKALVALSRDEKTRQRLANDLKNFRASEILKDFARQSALFYLLADGLNFCFWHPDEKKKFGYKNHSGSVALGYLILKAMKKYPEFFTPRFLKNFAPAVYAAIMSRRPEEVGVLTEASGENSRGELQLPTERIKIIQEIGKFLEKFSANITFSRHGEIMRGIVNKFQNKDINLFADFIAKHLPYTFGDVSIKHGIKLPFYKKLRLLISDLYALGGVKFKNMEKLLIYADYKIPQVFIAYKVFDLPEKILQTIKNRELMPRNSDIEVALRAASVVAASELKKITKLSYLNIDFRLWLLSKKLSKTSLPHHRTMGRFY